jgi:aerobic-type carbon monoxide dehydrogenase small subunit (CoxS/CutS family)
MKVRVTVNGAAHEHDVEPRLLLSDYIRQHLGLTGTHVGCEHGVCGACTILFDGEPARSCIMLAVQADGHRVDTVESLSPDGETLHPLQAAFREAHGLQCGFCTPGVLMTLTAFLRDHPQPSDEAVARRTLRHACGATKTPGCSPAARAS